MKVLRKKQLILLSALYVMCIFMLKPITVSAAGKVPGGVNNKVFVNIKAVYKDDSYFNTSVTYQATDGWEIVGYYYTWSNGLKDLCIRLVKDGKMDVPNSDNLFDYTGFSSTYDKNGNIKSSDVYTMSDDPKRNQFSFFTESDYPVYSYTFSGMKIFANRDAFDAYVKNGSLDDLLNPDNVDSGDYDSEIGYLHDLKHHALMYGEQDENGFYGNNDTRFTWSDYYPEYDDSYLVEVRASYKVIVKKWFGLGKKIEYNSNIRRLADKILYKDLECIVSSAEVTDLFADFINEYCPDPGVTVGYFSPDSYYFRIYRWDDEDESYHYGKWVRLKFEDDSTEYELEAGDIDKEGNWKTDHGSDYGDGKHGSTIVGAGDDFDDAKAEADLKQEEKDNGGKQLDLSNTNLKELWEWFTASIYNLFTGLGAIPDFFARLFSFLPSPVIGFLAVGIVVAIILRVLGR